MTKRINGVRDLNVYRVAFDAAMEIFDNLDDRPSSIVHRNQKGETKK